MNSKRSFIKRFCACESGAAGIEYGLIAAAISLAIVASLAITGEEAAKPFEGVAKGLKSANP